MGSRVFAAVVFVFLAVTAVWWHEPWRFVLAGGWGLAWLSVELDERAGKRIARRRRR